jgi:type II secretion system (T2SS) protein M
MKMHMSGRDRRALMFGVVSIAILLAMGKGAPKLISWERGARSDASDQQEDFDRATAEIARVSEVRDSAKARGARLIALAPQLVGGDSPATASATLAGIISGAAALSNVKIGALQLEADTSSRGTFMRVGIRGEATGDIAGLAAMLAKLEGGPTLLAVRELSITQTEIAAPADHMEALRIEMKVEGLMLRPRKEQIR